ncbi:response regulator [bacterium]|nr:response regulator [bacterium]
MSDVSTRDEADLAEPDAARPQAKRIDMLQLAFWGALTVAAGAAGMSLTWSDAVGPSGVVLIIALGMMLLVLAVWMLRGAGKRLGLFPERGAAEAAAAENHKLAWLEALDEPALITDRGGAPVAANAAYFAIAEISEDAGQAGHAPSVDRLLGASPGMAAPIYRLSKAAKAGDVRRETLPMVLLGDAQSPVQFEASVSPLGKTRALWRLRRIDETTSLSRADGAINPGALYIEDAPVGFFCARRDGRVVYINAVLRRMLGLSDEPAGLRLEDILRPEGLRLMKREARGVSVQRAEVVMRARDGVETPATLITVWSGKGPEALSRSVVHVSAGGEATAVRRPAALSISSSSGAVGAAQIAPSDDTMFADAPFGVVRLDGDSVETAVMLDANRSLREITDGRAQPGARFADLFVADQGPASLAEELARALDRAVELKLPGEPQRTVDVFIALDRNGRPAAAYVIDTTEKKNLELRLAQGEKMQTIGQLGGELAHNFNNLLLGVLLNVNKLQIRHPPGDPTFVELKAINEFVSRGAEMVRMLLAYSRRQVFRQDVFDISDMLSDYFVLLRDIIDERVKLDIVHGRDLPMIRADRNQIETALTNLCTNARDAMIEKNGGGNLVIRTSRATAAIARTDGFNHAHEGDYLLIEVIDDGAGMPAEILDKIFQPFFTTKDPGAGTGLGLATVYGIVKQSEGYIYPVSKPGRGTTFKIFLPAWTGKAEEAPAPQPAQEATPQPASGDLAGRGRILLVEDEEAVRGIAAQLLESLGYQVIEAGDGEKALSLIKENVGGIDLLISDVVLPGMDGPALFREARPHLRGARVMFISGYAERDLAKALEEERAISFLPKPFTLRQLAERVKSELMLKEAA